MNEVVSRQVVLYCVAKGLMVTDSSPVKDYYPVDFETDLNGKLQDWEAVVLIPFIDEVATFLLVTMITAIVLVMVMTALIATLLLLGHAQLNRHLSIMGLVNDPSCNQCSVAIESASHFLCQCDRFITLRQKNMGKIIFTPSRY